ncbi:proteasome subunit beta [Ectopseudomonas mendocina]|uniref:Proteasome subunit beta n=1 Tax=Ectopseudomonas mendocina TaxID=300 RepID=A0A379PPJ9_ECTME|nr:hypothetical protein [Pseudomonas mendocina]SUE95774.1 proteasome subunit beta [Pseudomonas mendocina]
MTTVAYDGRFLAADGRSTLGNLISGKAVKKIFQLLTCANGVQVQAVLAGAGSFQTVNIVKSHLERNDLFESELIPEIEPGSFQGLLVLETGEVYDLEDKLVPLPAEIPVAIGSGTDYAMAAMVMGKSAPAAVEVACELDVYSGGKIAVFDTETWAFVDIKPAAAA